LIGRLWRIWREKSSKFINSPLGRNNIAKIPCQVASFLKLPNAKSFTGHSLGRIATTLLADMGVSLINLKRFGRWKSDNVAQSYIDQSTALKTEVAQQLTTHINSETVQNASEEKKKQNSSFVYFSNCIFQGNVVVQK
jgi:malonyl CoA-acyl carrier protein transacylase